MCPNCAAGFVDELSIGAEAGGPAFIDAMHTFSVAVHSEDPNFEFVSTNGRMTVAVSAVPEPRTLPLLLAGLMAIGTALRRRAVGGRGARLSA